MVREIDINCDMGESFGMYKMGLDEEVIKYISSANIACGFHAGDPVWMQRTVKLAEAHGVSIGAHPSFPDLVGFGRRNMNISTEELRADILYQVGALRAFTKNKELQHVKPPGAMYNMAVKDQALAHSICDVLMEIDSNIILIALHGSKWIDIAKNTGTRVAKEIFSDRALNPDGTLVDRSNPEAVLHDINQVTDRTLKMIIEGRVETITGKEIEVQADSVCIHSDTPNAVQIASNLHSELLKTGTNIRPLNELV